MSSAAENYRFAITIRPDGTYSVDEVTVKAHEFLAFVYGLIGDGCDFIEAHGIQPGMFLLVDEEVFLRETRVVNVPLANFLIGLGCPYRGFQNAGVIVGETPDGSDLAGLTSAQVAELRPVLERVKR